MSDDELTTSPAEDATNNLEGIEDSVLEEPAAAVEPAADEAASATAAGPSVEGEANAALGAGADDDGEAETEFGAGAEADAEADSDNDLGTEADAEAEADSETAQAEAAETGVATPVDSDPEAASAIEPDAAEAELEPEIEPEVPAALEATPASETPASEVPVLENVSTTVSDTHNIPRFLTREQYEQVGDDPEPLPAGFEVIEGGATTAEQLPVISAEDVSPANASTPEADIERRPDMTQNLARAGAAVADAAASVGSMLSQGMGAVREVSAAKRAHSEAREQLDELSRVIGENEEELNHRRDVEMRYDELLAQQTERRQKALGIVASTQAAQEAIASAISDLKTQLDQMKEQDSATEKRLKAAVEEAESKEATARESANRLVRRVTDAQRALDAAKTKRDEQIAAAQAEIDTAQTRLRALREEFAGIQRNPSANSAAYSVRGGQLQADISDATERLRAAQEVLPRVTADGNQSVADAEAVLAAVNKPIDEARTAFREVSDTTATARDALDEAREDAETRQKALRTKINEQEKARREQEKAERDAQADADDAAFMLEDMADIHAHPEITEQLAARIASDRAYRAEQLQKVESLAETEQDVRERTRASRLRFTGALAIVILIVILVVLLWNVLVP